MTFIDVEFPAGLEYGYESTVRFPVTVVETEDSFQTRICRWTNPRRNYSLTFDQRTIASFAAILEFFNARRGPADSFKLRDLFDFSTAADHISAPARTDSVIGLGDGGLNQSFDLIKHYASGPVSVTRRLSRIVAGSTRVAVSGVDRTANCSVDLLTGTITFTSFQPNPGDLITAGCEFYTQARFKDHDVKELIQSFETKKSATLELVEVLEDIDAYEHVWLGGGQRVSFNKVLEITAASPRSIWLLPVQSTAFLIVPDPDTMPRGTAFFLRFTGSSCTILARPGLSSVGALSSSAETTLCVVETSSQTNAWRRVLA